MHRTCRSTRSGLGLPPIRRYPETCRARAHVVLPEGAGFFRFPVCRYSPADYPRSGRPSGDLGARPGEHSINAPVDDPPESGASSGCRQDSNLRPKRYERSELPLLYSAKPLSAATCGFPIGRARLLYTTSIKITQYPRCGRPAFPARRPDAAFPPHAAILDKPVQSDHRDRRHNRGCRDLLPG